MALFRINCSRIWLLFLSTCLFVCLFCKQNWTFIVICTSVGGVVIQSCKSLNQSAFWCSNQLYKTIPYIPKPHSTLFSLFHVYVVLWYNRQISYVKARFLIKWTIFAVSCVFLKLILALSSLEIKQTRMYHVCDYNEVINIIPLL